MAKVKKLVKYIETDSGRYFDTKSAIKEHWGLDVNYYSELKGLKLVDRNKKSHLVEIEKVEHEVFMDIALVYWKNGGYNCLDHAINQFKVVKNE